MFQRRKIQDIKPVDVLPVVGDAAVASQGIGEGRLIPLVIVDCDRRPEIIELLRVHNLLGPGDAKTQWASSVEGESRVFLRVTFIKPAEVFFVIAFKLPKHGILVEQALTSKAIYIQAGKEGDRLIHDVTKPKVLIEIGATGFDDRWNELFLKSIVKQLRNEGLNRQRAKAKAASIIAEIRQFNKLRMPDASVD